MADEKTPVDWREIEADYRAGTVSVREIGRWYGISDSAIRKKAKAGEWVRAKAPAGAQCEPAPVMVVRTPLTAENSSPEAIVSRGRNLVLRLLDELDATTTRLGELDILITSAVDAGGGDKAAEAMRQALTLKRRSDVLKSLALAAKTMAEGGGAKPGKKEQRQTAAENIGGKYATPAAPRTH